MNKKIAIAIGLAMLATMLLLANCADPLEPTGPNPSPEPIYIVDTFFDIDSILQIDTLRLFDTVFTGDTITRVDTVIHVDTVIQGGHHTYDTVYVMDTVQLIDTLIRVDTITQFDSVFVLDTIFVYDTVFVHDTVTQIDTVIIVQPDTGAFRPFCGTLASNQQEIVWMFTNTEGEYRLEFSSMLERVQPGQSLTVDIDGQTYFWDPIVHSELTLELHLKAHSAIRITSNVPPARGHAIYVCLQVTPL